MQYSRLLKLRWLLMAVFVAVIRVKLRQAVERGLMVDDPARLQPTPLGRAFLNDLLEIFLPEDGGEGHRSEPQPRVSTVNWVDRPELD